MGVYLCLVRPSPPVRKIAVIYAFPVLLFFQAYDICKQHFVLANHAAGQLHHQAGPVWWAPFLQSCAYDEACGGQCFITSSMQLSSLRIQLD